MLGGTRFETVWEKRAYYLKLEWIHPEWLRVLVALVVAIPVFIGTALVVGLAVLFLPMVVLVKYFGIVWGLLLWIVVYGYASTKFIKMLRHQHRNRPRRRPHHIHAK